jgi:hypothetical protein
MYVCGLPLKKFCVAAAAASIADSFGTLGDCAMFDITLDLELSSAV